MRTRWILKPNPNTEVIHRLQKELGIDDILARLLAQRKVENFEQAKCFFRPDLAELHDPMLMADMPKAVSRVLAALEEDQKILIYGDYDVDGTTSVAMMFQFLKQLTGHLDYYIPDRYTEGYGISKQGIDFAAKEGVGLIIALDCGIRALEMTDYATSKGIDLIICDHHQPGEYLPSAAAVLDPKRSDCLYPFKELSGCAVGFKLIQALCAELGLPSEAAFDYLDFLALSIAADIVPITGENRILAYHGLRKIREQPRLPFQLFLEKSVPYTNIEDLVFRVAPKINAAGRIEHAKLAVELMVSDDFSKVETQGALINQLNSTRKNLDSEITKEASEQIEKACDQPALVVFNSDWHKGVLGIVASRLVEKYHKPAVVFTQKDEKFLVASARSIPNFDLYNAISSCSHLLEKFGGHKYAAGLTMPIDNLGEFRLQFCQWVESNLKPTDKVPSLLIDSPLDIQAIDRKFLRILEQFSPFGPGNMNPIFLTQGVKVNNPRTMGSDNSHLRFTISSEDSSNALLNCVAFGMGHRYQTVQESNQLDIVYSIEKNHWNGNVSTQLIIKDFRPST